MKTKVFFTVLALMLSIGFVSAQKGKGYRGQGQGQSCQNINFIDEDQDGICDNFGSRTCGFFLDEDQDGICDNCGSFSCSFFVDEDQDGICDNLGNGTCANRGNIDPNGTGRGCRLNVNLQSEPKSAGIIMGKGRRR